MRIIAGRFGGRRLVAPAGSRTRPTTDRVRESLFSILGPLEGARALDLYAGSGALGLEALSRGAERVVFVESNGAAADAIRRNVAALEVGDAARVVGHRVERATRTIADMGPFDLVLCDPPWADLGAATTALAALVAAGAISDSARVVLEHASRDPSPTIEGLAREDARRYGDTTLAFYARANAGGAS